MKKTLAILSCTFLFACAAKNLIPTENDAQRVAAKFPGISLSDLNQGKVLFENNCGNCHGLSKSYHESESEIRKIMPEMAQKSEISSKDEDLILKYLITMNSAPKKS
jgi:nitrate/TMAO reductase-like tetraheme cytochrome c subunit